jgi:hypothetical protein
MGSFPAAAGLCKRQTRLNGFPQEAERTLMVFFGLNGSVNE